jgi:homoserine dehydrogenase
MFENSPVNHTTGQPALDHVRAALEAGMHAITANKGTVVHGYRELSALAASKGKRFLFESTVLGGSPLFSIFREAMPAAELRSFRGIINATTNVILSRMERGEDFEAAVKFCQSIGLAETDPSADVDGWDAAIKVAALVTVLMDVPLAPQQVERTGIRGITSEMIQQARDDGMR